MHLKLLVSNQNKKTKIMILYLLKILHTGCSTKEAITLLPSQSTWNFKRKWFSYIHFRWIAANQNNELESGHYAFWKCYIQEVLHIDEGSDINAFLPEHSEHSEHSECIQGAWRTKQCHCFCCGAPRVFKINEFYKWDMVNQWQIKINKLKLGHLTLWKCYEQGAPWKK